MITGSRMRAVDENAAALGVSRKQLMESSGHAVARTVRSIVEPGSRVAIVAGRGNNGGDAFVVPRFLDGCDCTLSLLGRPGEIGTTIARENWDVLTAGDYDTTTIRDSSAFDLPAADVVVDGMLGTGVSGDLREPVTTAAHQISESDGTVVSIDVPSGFDADGGSHADAMVAADHVVTFHAPKPGLGSLEATVTVADIGIPRAAERIVGPGDRAAAVTDRRAGRSLIVGGGPYTGAPTLAAAATLRAGMELTFVATPAAIASDVQGFAPDLVVQPFDGERLIPGHVPDLVETAERYDNVVVLGPGLGRDERTLEAVRAFLEAYSGRAVVDADALAVVPDVETDATLVCTPNTAELAAMGGPDTSDPGSAGDAIERFADSLGHVVLVKGATDVITDGVTTRRNQTGTPALAVGGTGDVLAGVVAALLEETTPMQAAAVGAYIVGRAGEELTESTGSGGTASDLLRLVPAATWGIDDE